MYSIMIEMIKMIYNEWMEKYNDAHDVSLMCAEATEEMVIQFPELIRVRGHVISTKRLDEVPHWWCTDPNGNILDPTEKQFGQIIAYYPHDESLPEPTGKCPNCGGYCYTGSTMCCGACEEEYIAYLGG